MASVSPMTNELFAYLILIILFFALAIANYGFSVYFISRMWKENPAFNSPRFLFLCVGSFVCSYAGTQAVLFVKTAVRMLAK